MTASSATPSPVPPSSASNPGIAGWRIVLRIGGVVFALGIFSYWFAAGANTGWTKDRVAVMKTDEVTGIEYPEYEKRFVPGIEFLSLGCGLGLLVAGATFFSRKKSKTI